MQEPVYELLRKLERPVLLSHSGKLGDIIYSLAAVKALGMPCELFLKPGLHMNRVVCDSIIPFLIAQPSIFKAGVWEGEEIDFDLDAFRRFGIGCNLADAHLIPLGLAPVSRDVPWLTLEVARSYSMRPVVFSRSKDYRGIPEFWERVYGVFGHLAAFVGTESEHALFQAEIGPIPKIPTPGVLELAATVAGAKLFVGNQSCPLAIAEGLKKMLIQEVCVENPNCIFYRDSSYPVLARSQTPAILREVAARLEFGR